jgi:glycine betaine/proline transport system substrate-binding protein
MQSQMKMKGSTMRNRKLTGFLAIGAAATLTLAGCSSDAGDNGDGDTGSEDMGTITLGFLPSWTDGLSTAYLLENQLEKLGYTVEMEELTEAGPLYTGLAQGDVDMYPSAWPEVTHAEYMEEYGDDIEDIGAYYEGAVLTIAVPDYVEISSIEELKGNADMFGGQIIGIEPGAGLTRVTQEEMIPAYELGDEYELVTSSTAAMLTELENAIAAEENIVVTSWRPFWANDAYNLRDLEDPMGAMGQPEALHFLGTSDFSERFPEAAELIAGIQLDDAQYASLEDMVVNEYGEGNEPEAIEAWLEANPDAFDTIITD